eukprot:623592-Rhodomonas_salina.2
MSQLGVGCPAHLASQALCSSLSLRRFLQSTLSFGWRPLYRPKSSHCLGLTQVVLHAGFPTSLVNVMVVPRSFLCCRMPCLDAEFGAVGR